MNNSSIMEINHLLKAKFPYIYLVSHDEEQCIKEIYRHLCLDKEMKETKKLFVWSSFTGMLEYTDLTFKNPTKASGVYEETLNPAQALSVIQTINTDLPAIYIFKDFHMILNPNIARQLRDMYTFMINSTKAKNIIGISGSVSHFHGAIKPGLEPSIEKQIAIVKWNLPNRQEIEEFLNIQLGFETVKNNHNYSKEETFAISRSLQGLNYIEIENAIGISQTEKGKLDPKRIMQEKKQIILRSDILEYIESNNSMNDLGGLDNLKQYLIDHANSDTDDAMEFGVEPLRGIVLVGIPGSGKSASAKAIGNSWGKPTLRLDVGKVMAGLVGASEQRMREAIQQAIATAPCVVWVDEIEKALSGTKSSNFSDGGTLSRVFGTLLTAMEEDFPRAGVTIVATANDISMLPAELIRRFSETFYVGLPTEKEREEIWAIHLKKKKRDPNKFNLNKLAIASKKFTGAEIEKSLKEAISVCFNDGKREVKDKDILNAIKATKPLYVVMFDKIRETEIWAKERARFASSFGEAEINGKQEVQEVQKIIPEIKPLKKKVKKLDLSNLDEDVVINKEENQEVKITNDDDVN